MLKKIILLLVPLALLLTPALAVAAETGNTTDSKNDISNPDFIIEVDKLFPWVKTWGQTEDINQTAGILIWTAIQKLMILLWFLSLAIMVVWTAYIVAYHGQDELLTKWKSMFVAGLSAMVIALLSYYIISLLRFVLFS